MKKWISILLLLIPALSFAGGLKGAISDTEFYLIFYIISIIPVIIWVLNIVVTRKLKKGKKTNSFFIWSIRILNLLLITITFCVIYSDINGYYGYKRDFSDYGHALIFLGIIPLIILINGFRFQLRDRITLSDKKRKIFKDIKVKRKLSNRKIIILDKLLSNLLVNKEINFYVNENSITFLKNKDIECFKLSIEDKKIICSFNLLEFKNKEISNKINSILNGEYDKKKIQHASTIMNEAFIIKEKNG